MKENYKKLFLKSNGYNLLGFLFDDGIVTFVCPTILHAAAMNLEGIEGSETAAEAAVNCNTRVYEFDESEWEDVIDLDDPELTVHVAVFSEYEERGSRGNDTIFSTEDKALAVARTEWYGLSEHDKKRYEDSNSWWYVYSAIIPFPELVAYTDPYGEPSLPLSEYEDGILWDATLEG